MTLEEAMDLAARDDGYDNWESFENWVVDHNHKANIAGLIKSRMKAATLIYVRHQLTTAMAK